MEKVIEQQVTVRIADGVVDWDDPREETGDQLEEQLQDGLHAIEMRLREQFPHLDVQIDLDGQRVRS